MATKNFTIATVGKKLFPWMFGGAAAIGAVGLGVAGNRPTDKTTLLDRVRLYRGGGSAGDGIHVLMQPVKITALDYALMGADNSCARILAESRGIQKTGPFSDLQWLEQRWFAVDPHGGLERRQDFYNAHYTNDILEAALMEIPRPEFQVDPREVVWHHLRVQELKAQGVELEQRVATMTTERKSKPWLTASVR